MQLRCRTLLFMPGNNPGMLSSSQNLGADVVIFDLEDAVAQTEKDAARILVRNALSAMRSRLCPVVVRINALDTPYWRADVQAAITGNADFLLVPKCSRPDDILLVQKHMQDVLHQTDGQTPPGLLALIEGALGVENAFQLATAHPWVQGVLLGAEDLTAELGAKRTPKGDEIFYARSRVLMACKAAGITAIDTPYPFVNDLEGLAVDAALAVQLGFDAKAVISPHHVHAVNQAFSPAPEQVHWAQRVMAVARQAARDGKGAVSLDGMMIDLPIIKRAERILLRAGCPEEASHA